MTVIMVTMLGMMMIMIGIIWMQKDDDYGDDLDGDDLDVSSSLQRYVDWICKAGGQLVF